MKLERGTPLRIRLRGVTAFLYLLIGVLTFIGFTPAARADSTTTAFTFGCAIPPEGRMSLIEAGFEIVITRPEHPLQVSTFAYDDRSHNALTNAFRSPGFLAPRTSHAKYDPDFAIGQLTRGGDGTASQLVNFADSQGWQRVKTPGGPVKYVDENGIPRLTIKRGSSRTPGSELPHVEIRNASGHRINPYGAPVTRNDPGNHTPIQSDLE